VTVGAGSIARAVESGREDVLFRLTVGADERILGAALVGPGAGEVVHAILPYVRHRLTWRELEQAMHVHPTYAEALSGLARKLMG
jgi:dihydrolipoamide dehydrogenase